MSGLRISDGRLKNGLWLLRDEHTAYAIVLSQHDDYGRGGDVIVEVAAPPGERGAALCTRVFDALELRLSKGSCYRGRVLSLEQRYHISGHAPRICVHELEGVARTDIILPEPTLLAVERNVLRFAVQREALRGLGLSTQKGLLFYGAPGTGKTHCIRYLAGRLPGHTTLLITAEGAGLLPEYMALARLLQPALVVIEDADLIARERTQRDSPCDEVMLNRLLNEMDGLRERAEVFFILTTNRPDTLEPALASRPGRIDQAIEFPLPDEALRKRLITLYAKNLPIAPQLVDELAHRTDGASPAFIKELLRRVAQHHLDADSDGEVSRQTVEAALHAMKCCSPVACSTPACWARQLNMDKEQASALMHELTALAEPMNRATAIAMRLADQGEREALLRKLRRALPHDLLDDAAQ
jgi:hypothetical protein